MNILNVSNNILILLLLLVLLSLLSQSFETKEETATSAKLYTYSKPLKINSVKNNCLQKTSLQEKTIINTISSEKSNLNRSLMHSFHDLKKFYQQVNCSDPKKKFLDSSASIDNWKMLITDFVDNYKCFDNELMMMSDASRKYKNKRK